MLLDLLNSGSNVTVAVSIRELKVFADYLIAATRRELEDEIAAQQQEKYLTAKQVSEILNVHPSTISRWKERGYLIPCEIGGKRRYKLSDLKALLGNAAKGGSHE